MSSFQQNSGEGRFSSHVHSLFVAVHPIARSGAACSPEVFHILSSSCGQQKLRCSSHCTAHLAFSVNRLTSITRTFCLSALALPVHQHVQRLDQPLGGAAPHCT